MSYTINFEYDVMTSRNVFWISENGGDVYHVGPFATASGAIDCARLLGYEFEADYVELNSATLENAGRDGWRGEVLERCDVRAFGGV